MGRRPIVLFWGFTAAAVLFLGTVWTVAGRLGSGPHALADSVGFGIAATGLVATSFIAGRIAFVVGRAQRQARLEQPRRSRLSRTIGPRARGPGTPGAVRICRDNDDRR